MKRYSYNNKNIKSICSSNVSHFGNKQIKKRINKLLDWQLLLFYENLCEQQRDLQDIGKSKKLQEVINFVVDESEKRNISIDELNKIKEKVNITISNALK